MDSRESSIDSGGLNITGYVGQYGTYSDLSKIKILIFNDWDLAAEAYANADGFFSVQAGGLGASTNVKIECDGYLPRFYKNRDTVLTSSYG